MSLVNADGVPLDGIVPAVPDVLAGGEDHEQEGDQRDRGETHPHGDVVARDRRRAHPFVVRKKDRPRKAGTKEIGEHVDRRTDPLQGHTPLVVCADLESEGDIGNVEDGDRGALEEVDHHQYQKSICELAVNTDGTCHKNTNVRIVAIPPRSRYGCRLPNLLRVLSET